jgi:hypothetical protein
MGMSWSHDHCFDLFFMEMSWSHDHGCEF